MCNQLVCLCRVSCMWLSSAVSCMFKSEFLVQKHLHSKESVFFIFLQERLKFGIFKPRLVEENLFDHIYYLSISNLIISFTKYKSNVPNSCQNKGYPNFPLQFQAPKKNVTSPFTFTLQKIHIETPPAFGPLTKYQKIPKIQKPRECTIFTKRHIDVTTKKTQLN